MKKILLVEDDNLISDMYSSKFVREGYEVVLAKDGNDALAKAKEIKPDLILLDIVLPKKDGFEVLKALKKNDQTKDITVIFLTNLGEGEDIKKGMQSKADGYLIKAHSTPDQIVSKVNEMLGN